MDGLAAAAEGDTIYVHPGKYEEGTIRVTKRVHLQGIGSAVLDGSNKHEVMLVSASGATIRGLTFQNVGRTSTADQAGVRVELASDVVVEDNTLRNCHFGIYLAKAKNCRVRQNHIMGVPDLEQNCGNGIHLWSCEGITVQKNSIRGHRDGIYLEFSSRATVEENAVQENLRYGLHFMNSHDSAYRWNRFTKNGAGVAVMYSRHVEMAGNQFDYNWGASSYGLLLKDITDSTIAENVFDHNSTAIYSQGATRIKFERNLFQQNGWALRILSSGEGNSFRDNDFTGNSFDVATNGQLVDHLFAGNYWDRCEGYDLNHDGQGDVPYHPVSLYGMLVEKVPASVLLLRSAMSHLMDRAEKAFPSVTPDSVVDSSPSLKPHALVRHHSADSPPTIHESKQQKTAMKTSNIIYIFLLAGCVLLTTQCGEKPAAGSAPASSAASSAAPGPGQSAVDDPLSEKDVVKVAVGSKDHTTLVKAVQTAELVDVLSNAGPFTVFAPTNEAFAKLPAGTVENLLKPENKEKLQDILQYHVAVGVFKPEMLKDGMTLNMANSANTKIAVKDGKVSINGANIIGTVKASNGIIHVVDAVVLPPPAK